MSKYLNKYEGEKHPQSWRKNVVAKSAEHTRAETGCSPRGQAALPDALSSHSFRATQRMTPVDQCPEPCPSTLQERCPLICKQNIHLLQGGSLLSENHCVSKTKDWQWAGTLHPGSTQASGHHRCSGCLLGHTPWEGG